MPFDKNLDKIAITIPKFTLLRPGDLLSDYSEPYILSIAVDGQGVNNPTLFFNSTSFPKVGYGKKGTVRMLGDGHLLYGPSNPGSFVALSVLFMESDSDVRELGKTFKDILDSKAANLGVRALLAASPGHAAVIAIIKELAQHVAGEMKNNGDDELFRVEGSFLRDKDVPYDINRQYEYENDYLKSAIRIIPLNAPNGQGAPIQELSLV